MSINEWWGLPKSRDVGYFSDLSLYLEALKITSERGSITTSYLREEISQRTQGLKLVNKQSPSKVKDLVRELQRFDWLQKESELSKTQQALYTLTSKGKQVLTLDSRAFNHQLAVKMQDLFTIPGWFVDRLWKINPKGQGEIILPSPLKDWKPEPRPWEKKQWDEELKYQALRASKMADFISPGSFPIEEEAWIKAVKSAWNHLGTWKRKSKKISTFSTRRRLSLAMRRAAVEILFSSQPPGESQADIWTRQNKLPLYPRTFRVWCPRLAELEMVFYTDKHPDVVGRLVFPTAAFRNNAPHPPFEKLSGVEDPENNPLWLYQPRWEDQSEIFTKTLIETYRITSRRAGTLYVSLLDVRDEVCRRLRLSFRLFDEFLSYAFRISLRSESDYSISIEADIREDQRSGSGLVRRPVWIEEVPYSLIAIGKSNL
jgi:hypothetical protein